MKQGRILRPKAAVLNESAMIPTGNLLAPPPNQFTHELPQAQPYYYTLAQAGKAPDGEFAAGTQVVLLVHDGTESCRVADGQGLYVATAYKGLRPL